MTVKAVTKSKTSKAHVSNFKGEGEMKQDNKVVNINRKRESKEFVLKTKPAVISNAIQKLHPQEIANALTMARLSEMKCNKGSYDDSSGEIYVTLETAMKLALDEGGERGKALYDFLCNEQEKIGKASISKIEAKMWLAALEARARRAAKRVGLLAIKSTDRDSKAQGKKDRFKFIDPSRGLVLAGEDYDVPAADVIGICNNLPEFISAMLKGRSNEESISTSKISKHLRG